MWDCRHVSCWTSYLVCVSVSKSDSRHEADSPFHAITEVCILNASAVLVMSINRGVNEAHHYDPKLEASRENLCGQVMEKTVSLLKCRSLSPKRSKHVIQRRAFVVVVDSRVHPDFQLDTFVPLIQCEIVVPYMARCKGCEGNQR